MVKSLKIFSPEAILKSTFFKKILLIFLCISVAAGLAACGEGEQKQSQLFSMGTTFTLMAYGPRADAGIKSAEQTIIAVDALTDPEVDTSTCYAINHAQGSQLNISGQVAEMLIDAKEIYEKSDGAYDLTIYPVVKRWGFTDGRYYVPSDEEIAEDLARKCMDQLNIASFPNSGTYAVSLPSYGELDFSSCARGCASKYAIDAMRKNGITSAIVSLSGNVQTLGLKPDGTEWKIGIVDSKNVSTYLGTISVGETAIVTTGAYQNYMTGSTKYHHIFNTKSGYPTSNGLASVTVICEDGTVADCLSTALYAMGQTKALNYWRANGGFDMIIITDSGEIVCTAGLLEKFDVKNDYYTLSYVE